MDRLVIDSKVSSTDVAPPAKVEQVLTQPEKQSHMKYKSQNCRAFHKDKYCPYGSRCVFRHEYRSFQKIHRHFYMMHVNALRSNFKDLIADVEESEVFKTKMEAKDEVA